MATKADLEKENARLKAMLYGEEEIKGSRFLRVENQTTDFVTLVHPITGEGETLQPRQLSLVDRAYLRDPSFVKAVQGGLLTYRESDQLDDDGREAALGALHRFEDRHLENNARQILLYPGEDLHNRAVRAVRLDGSQDVDVMADIIYEMINFMPKHGKRVDVEYLQTVHRNFLERVMERERTWRNRPGIIEPILARIAEIDRMDSLGQIRNVQPR